MAIKRRVATFNVQGSTATGTIGLGAVYGKVFGFEFKGDDGAVTTSTAIELVDATGRILVTAFAPDTGTDDSTLKATNQSYSTVGVYRTLSFDESAGIQSTGAVITDNVGGTGPGTPAKSPITVNLSSGVSGDNHQVVLWVEV